MKDTLNGYCIEYNGAIDEGVYIKGIKTGKWVHKSRKKKKRVPGSFIVYGHSGNILSKGYTYSNGHTSSETFYSASGKDVWYVYYDSNGCITYQGPYILGRYLKGKK